jgi:hypothetical protein
MKLRCLILASTLGLGLATINAAAQAWPAKPIKAIVPIAAGSVIDTVPRVVFEQFATVLVRETAKLAGDHPREGSARGRKAPRASPGRHQASELRTRG